MELHCRPRGLPENQNQYGLPEEDGNPVSLWTLPWVTLSGGLRACWAHRGGGRCHCSLLPLLPHQSQGRGQPLRPAHPSPLSISFL